MSGGTRDTPIGLQVELESDERDVRVGLEVAAGERVALLGPNGSGKSTVLNTIAGLIRPDRGRASLGEKVLFDLGGTAHDRQASRRVWRPPYARGTSLLAQEALLFPHLSVIDNVGFGPRSTGAGRSEARATARQWLDRVGAAELADRRPDQVSGGQAQRVAIARALAAQPDLLLLDEPLAALDVAVAVEVRQLLSRVLATQTTVLVTHEVLDALLLADRVVVLERGRVVESGTTAEVLTRPRSRFGAQFAGLNFATGVFDDGALRTAEGVRLWGTGSPVPAQSQRAVAVFRPSAVIVSASVPTDSSPRNVHPATVTELEPMGDLLRVHTDRFAADLTAAAVAELGLRPGSEVILSVKASEVAIYSA